MKLDRNTRRLLTHLQEAGVPQVTDIPEAIHILAQAGLIEYEAYKCFPDMVRAWAVPLTGEVDTDGLHPASKKPTRERSRQWQR